MSLKSFFGYGMGRRERVVVSERLKNNYGKTVEFTVRGLSEDEIRGIEANSEEEFVRRIIIMGCIEPELDDEAIMQGLLPGEAYALYGRIISASGLGKDFSALKGEVSSMLIRGESEAVYACLAAFEMGLAPSDYLKMGVRERACIAAFIDEKIRIKNSRGR